MLAIANFRNPLFWAVLIGWILSVVLHEFAHGIVAYWGGDYTIRERGGLTLNPLQYIDPVFSILLPIVFLAMGGIPLPGGVTYIRRDLIRSRAWNSAVSLAGPAMNLIIFFACIIPLHPKVGWLGSAEPTSGQVFLGTMAVLQLMGVILNLIPVPPLDGFQAISPWLAPEFRDKVGNPPISTFLLFGFFVAMWRLDLFPYLLIHVMFPVLEALGFDDLNFFIHSFNSTLFG